MSDLTQANEKWVLSFESGRNWLPHLPSSSTKEPFIRHLKKYSLWAKMNPDELINFKIEGLKAVATEKEFQAERMLEKYLRQTGMTQSVAAYAKNAIISFYKHNWRELNSEVARDIEPPEAKKRTPKLEEIQELESNCTTARDRALIWFFPSTGFRIGTLTKLFRNDLKPTGDAEVPYYLEIEAKRLKGSGIGKYKGLKQITFVNSFVWAKMQDYFAEAKRRGFNLTEDSPLFIGYKGRFTKEERKLSVKPKKVRAMTEGAINNTYDNASLAAWKDLEVKRFSPHDNRDVLQSALENVVNDNMIAPMLAHKPKNAVDFHYSSHLWQELLPKYKLALPKLIPQTTAELKIEINQQKATNQKQQSEIEAIKEEMNARFEKLASLLKSDAKVLPPENQDEIFRLKTNGLLSESEIAQKLKLKLKATEDHYIDENGKELDPKTLTEEQKKKFKSVTEYWEL